MCTALYTLPIRSSSVFTKAQFIDEETKVHKLKGHARDQVSIAAVPEWNVWPFIRAT